ncbi:FAD-binding domain-containing protein [Phellopilus nigrolimitatus]|nr:FAD-binding domain-containing protein [Phellopilus nigrolimitatus]
MRRTVLATTLLMLGTLVFDASSQLIGSEDGSSTAADKACQSLNETFPEIVSFPGSEQFADDVEHWTVSSQQNATCSVEPRDTSDVSAIMKLIGRPDIRAPFAVKSGGHSFNPGFSSTPGVQISLARLTDLVYDETQGTVTIGMGLTWTQVYEQLEPLGVMVTGGRINGVGVGGFSLGGGFSWKTNQYGLTIDTIVAHEVVLPSGQQVNVTNATEPDLFFALKGGLNNFGIVTKITLETHNQSLVYGGALTYSSGNLSQVNSAVSDFSQNNTDPKAQMVVTYVYTHNEVVALVFIFYDGPTPPAGIFDSLLAIPTVASEVKTQTFVNFVSTFVQVEQPVTGPFGDTQHVIPIVQYTQPLLDEMATQVQAFGANLTAQNNGSTVVVGAAPELFLNPFSHSRGGAYPHPPSREVTPAATYISYQTDPNLPFAAQSTKHALFVSELKQLSYNIQARAVSEGVSRWDDILYPNYALADSPLELLYGSNLERCKALAAKYDPQRVMSLTGGFYLGN